MKFFDQIQSLGILETTKSFSYSKNRNPVLRMRENFSNKARKQIKLVGSGAEASPNSWYIREPRVDGGHDYRVSLRCGVSLIPLQDERTHIRVDSPEKAIQFFELAVEACEAGDFDKLFEEAMRSKKKEEPQQNTTGGNPMN